MTHVLSVFLRFNQPNARPLATLDLVAESGFAGGCLFQTEQCVAQIVLGSQRAQRFAGFLAAPEQAVSRKAKPEVEIARRGKFRSRMWQ